MDLGGASLARTRMLAGLRPQSDPESPVMAAQLLHRLRSDGAVIGTVEAGLGKGLAAPQALGLSLPQFRRMFQSRAQGLAEGAVMVTVGLLLPKPAVLALTLFGFGILRIGYFFGKAE